MRAGLAFVLLVVADPAAAQTPARTADTVLMSTDAAHRAAQERIGYAEAVVAGDSIYLSGLVVGQAPGETGLEPGFERVFRQIGRTLERAGATYADIVEMSSFHTAAAGGIEAQVAAMSAVTRRLVGSPPPAWTAVEVTRLLPPTGIAEVRIVARRRAPPAPPPPAPPASAR